MKLLRIKLFFNILLTLVTIFWLVNLCLPEDLQLIVGHYWWWFCTTIVILTERWIMFFVFDETVKEFWRKNKKQLNDEQEKK